MISELTIDTLNYGNRLQAYALNDYIEQKLDKNVVSLSLNFLCVKRIYYKVLQRVLNKLFKKNLGVVQIPTEVANLKNKRLQLCKEFTHKKNVLNLFSKKELAVQTFESVIVGSDTVWVQNEFAINKLKFLSFKLKRPFKKFSYAASFGKNWIPEKNKKYIKKYLDDFTAISVREKSSIELLKSIGVENVVHVCDPTLLLTVEEWSSVAEPVEAIQDKYIFVYLLGKDVEQRKSIQKLAKKYNLKIATIPHADNVYNSVDDDFGDYKLMDASPENWVWLIKNAEYVITDSFHGTIFSVIFSKRFIVINRCYTQDINIRMTDFLDTINEQDKFVDITEVESFEELIWDYEKIHRATGDFIEISKMYLEKNLN